MTEWPMSHDQGQRNRSFQKSMTFAAAICSTWTASDSDEWNYWNWNMIWIWILIPWWSSRVLNHHWIELYWTVLYCTGWTELELFLNLNGDGAVLFAVLFAASYCLLEFNFNLGGKGLLLTQEDETQAGNGYHDWFKTQSRNGGTAVVVVKIVTVSVAVADVFCTLCAIVAWTMDAWIWW